METAEVLTVGRVARLAECSSETVRRAIDAGALPATKASGGLRLIERGDAEAFARARLEQRSR